MWGATDHCGWCHLGQVVLGFIKCKLSKLVHTTLPWPLLQFLHPCSCIHVPALISYLGFPWWQTVTYKPNKSFLPKLLLSWCFTTAVESKPRPLIIIIIFHLFNILFVFLLWWYWRLNWWSHTWSMSFLQLSCIPSPLFILRVFIELSRLDLNSLCGPV